MGETERTFENVVSTPGPHSRESEEKPQHIVLHSAQLFAEQGYEASIREISRATGVSLSGLSYYFESKPETAVSDTKQRLYIADQPARETPVRGAGS